MIPWPRTTGSYCSSRQHRVGVRVVPPMPGPFHPFRPVFWGLRGELCLNLGDLWVSPRGPFFLRPLSGNYAFGSPFFWRAALLAIRTGGGRRAERARKGPTKPFCWPFLARVRAFWGWFGASAAPLVRGAQTLGQRGVGAKRDLGDAHDITAPSRTTLATHEAARAPGKGSRSDGGEGLRRGGVVVVVLPWCAVERKLLAGGRESHARLVEWSKLVEV